MLTMATIRIPDGHKPFEYDTQPDLANGRLECPSCGSDCWDFWSGRELSSAALPIIDCESCGTRFQLGSAITYTYQVFPKEEDKLEALALKLRTASSKYGIMSADFLWALAEIFSLLGEKYGEED